MLFFKKKSSPAHGRAPFFWRLAAAAIDLGLVAVVLNLFPPVAKNLALCGVFGALYWWSTETFLGRSPAKFICMIKYDKPLTWSHAAIRAFFRFALGPLCMLSWRRITLLDLITGLRVIPIHVTVKIEDPEVWGFR